MSNPRRFVPEYLKQWTDSSGRPIAIAEVTWRTICGLFLLAPTKKNRDLLLGVVGRAQDKYDFEIYSMAWLSNHGSMLIGIRSAKHLSKILRFIGSNIPKELGVHGTSRWRGKFWARRARAILIDGDARLIERMRYVNANGVKENLVRHPTQWPGAHAADALCNGRPLIGIWYDRTKMTKARRRGDQIKPKDFTTRYRIKLTQIPCWADMPDWQYRGEMNRMCDEIAADAEALRVMTGKTVLGVKRCRAINPHHQPETLDRSPAPAVHAPDRASRTRFHMAYRTFLEAYQIANRALKCGAIEAQFPEGGCVPGALMTT